MRFRADSITVAGHTVEVDTTSEIRTYRLEAPRPDRVKLFVEKLSEVHGLRVSVSRLRTWMTDAQLWVPRLQRERSVHQPRARRECYGELIQIDGSDHEWFEARAQRSRCGALRR